MSLPSHFRLSDQAPGMRWFWMLPLGFDLNITSFPSLRQGAGLCVCAFQGWAMMLNLTAPDRKPGQGAIGLVLNPTNRDGKGLRFRLAEVSVEPPVHNESCSRYKHAESMLVCRLQTRRPINRVLFFFLAAGVPQTRHVTAVCCPGYS